MQTKEQRAKRAKLVADARAISDAVKDGETMSAEDSAKFDAIMAEADKLKADIDRIERLDDALARRRQTLPAPDPLPVTTWGRNRSLETWSGPKVADLAWRTRRAELALRHAGRASANPAALRALLALQSSDWAFLADGERTGDYPRERADAHAAALGAAIQSGGSDPLEGLAPDLAESALFRP